MQKDHSNCSFHFIRHEVSWLPLQYTVLACNVKLVSDIHRDGHWSARPQLCEALSMRPLVETSFFASADDRHHLSALTCLVAVAHIDFQRDRTAKFSLL